jgi:hypothetical protein
MNLPQEVRDEIYANVFYSTRFTYAFEGHPLDTSARETGLALMRTCRRVRDEIGISWLHQVLFDFVDPTTLLNKLAYIPIALRGQIRHLCISARELMLGDEWSESWHDTTQVLKLLPGLKLDTLTVVGTGAWRPLESFYNLDKLIRHSDGWKELHYLSDNSEPLAFKVDGTDATPGDPKPECSPRPQPSDWQNTVEQRDGQASHPSVAVYQATPVVAPGAVMLALHPCIQEVFAQACTTDHLRRLFTRDAKFFIKFEDATPMTRGALWKHTLAVVKRGVRVDYAEKEGSPYLPSGDIRKYYPGTTWREINPPPSPVCKYDAGWY